jgi:hypothetical protein
MNVAMINRAVAVNAAIFSPEVICSAVIPLTKAPKGCDPDRAANLPGRVKHR